MRRPHGRTGWGGRWVDGEVGGGSLFFCVVCNNGTRVQDRCAQAFTGVNGCAGPYMGILSGVRSCVSLGDRSGRGGSREARAGRTKRQKYGSCMEKSHIPQQRTVQTCGDGQTCHSSRIRTDEFRIRSSERGTRDEQRVGSKSQCRAGDVKERQRSHSASVRWSM